MIPPDLAMPAERLREAVPGLAGIAGLLLFPMLGAWLRVLLETSRWDPSGLGRPRRLSGRSVLKAAVLTVGLAFFAVTMVRAAGELRDLQAEAPVVGPIARGAALGIAFWALYAIGLSTLRKDAQRHRTERRMGGRLR